MRRPLHPPSLALMLAALLPAQREAPAPRTDAAHGRHLAWAPHQYRGANLWTGTSLSAAAFWNQWPGNRDAVEATLAHMARAGVNVVRVFLDYKSFLWSRLWEAPDDPDAYGRKVRALCDLADRYEIGVIPVLFNGFGTNPSGIVARDGEPPGPTVIVGSPGLPGFADVLGTQPGPDGIAAAGGRRSLLRICLSPPSGPSWPHETQRTPDALFDDPQWLRDPAVRHGFVDYLDCVGRMAGGSAGLLQWQLFNEPDFLATRTIGAGAVVRAVLDQLRPGASPVRNPHDVPCSVSAASYLTFGAGPRSLARTGFEPPELFGHLVGWSTHIWPDTWVHRADRPLLLDVGAQHRFMVRPAAGADPALSLHAEHQRDLGADAGPHTAFTDAAGARHVSLQTLNDVVLACATDADPQRRLGVLLWSFLPSDVGGGEGGPLVLPGGTVLSWREAQALRDNWRRPVRSVAGAPPAEATADGAPAETRVDRGFSDALLPLLLTAPIEGGTDCVALAVAAENFDDQPEHGERPADRDRSADRNTILARAARVGRAGPIAWSARVTVDGGPGAGPLVVDEAREAFNLSNPRQPGKDALWPGSAHPELEAPALGAGPGALLRCDVLMRQKLRDQPEALRPQGVYAGRQDGRHVFWLAWCRPVHADDAGGERCHPWDDAARAGGGGNAYFATFKEHGGRPGAWKYEVLLRRLGVTEDTPPRIDLGPLRVLRTRGVRGETWAESRPAGTGTTRPAHAGEAGAAAVDVRLFASTAGDLLVVYRKSQDSWFDVPLECPDGVDAAFERRARWHVYPWELFAQVHDANNGDWLRARAGGPPLELRVSAPWPGDAVDPLGDWQRQVATQIVYQRADGQPKNGPVRRRLRLADLFPAVDAQARIWRGENGTLAARVAFKQLCTWLDESERTRHPSGYDLLTTSIDVAGGTPRFAPPVRLLPPPAAGASEADFVHGEPGIAAVPGGGGASPCLVVAQQGRELWITHTTAGVLARVPTSEWQAGAGSHSAPASAPAAATRPARTEPPPFFVADHATGAERSGRALVAWLCLQAPRRVVLRGLLVTSPDGPAAPRAGPAVTLWEGASPADLDFEARIAGAWPRAGDAFEVVWHQGGALRALPVAVRGESLVPGAARVLAGGASALHSGKLHVSATERGVLFAHRGDLRFVRS